MATVATIRTVSDALSVTSYPILEPLNAPKNLLLHLKRFGDNYNLSNESHLYRFLITLCGDTGAGRLKKEMLLPRLEQALESTSFNNLDRFYGNPLGLPRLNTEIYTYDPETDILNSTQWGEVLAKDASYRGRCLTWMRAIINGSTIQGMALAAEAAIGIEADIWERYQYVQNPTATSDIGKTSSTNEFVILPRTATLAPSDTRQITRLVDQLKPVNSIATIRTGISPRAQRFSRLSASTSDYFNIQRLVTGRPDITWPSIDLSEGNWISTSETEAPTYAFMNRQESVTYLTITNATASSEHIGYFSQAQQQLFAQTRNVQNPYVQFTAMQAYDNSIAPVNLSVDWNGGGNIVVNNNYPIGYFANVDSSFTTAQQPAQLFWASTEKFSTDTINETVRFNQFEFGDGTIWGETVMQSNSDWIQFDFGRERPMNYIHFEICQKPIDWTIQYMDGGTWTDIPLRDDYPVVMSSTYLPSDQNPWMEFDAYFNVVQAQYVRILFTRRTDPFPLTTSDPIAFSIDMRGLRIMHTIPTVADFVADAGVDILGNNFRTAIITYDSTNVTDGTDTYWQSQPNPSRFAVEALYFDMRLGSQAGTMTYLDSQFMDELDTRSMSDMENYYIDGQLIDEVYLDPTTFGPDMHFYYSDDDTPDWDEKLWVPIPQNYTLRKGFHALPRPTFVRYFKIEFSNLTPTPYEPVQYPIMPPVTYRRYPLWVNNYFINLNINTTKDVIAQTENITIDPLSFGFTSFYDVLSSSFEDQRTLQLADTTPEINTFIQDIVSQAGTITDVQTQIESQIEFRSPIMWQSDLISNLDSTRALSRIALLPDADSGLFDSGWNAELALPATPVPVQASSTDLSEPLKEKTMPPMWFSRRCRHEYQIVRAPIERKIAYIVGVKNVGFWRRDYTAAIDEPLYTETLDDTAHIASNDFVQNDWRYVVG